MKGRSVYLDYQYGPLFGNGSDLNFGNNKSDFTLENSNYSNFPNSYSDILGKGKSIFTGDFNNENSYFKLQEIEVFQLIE